MAQASRKGRQSSREYDDDDDIDQAIREYKGETVPPEQQEPPPLPEPIPVAVVEEDEDVVLDESKIPICGCCQAKWVVVRGRINRPGCGCLIHPTCRRCERCIGIHCKCQQPIH
jgi:hypothetical protein